MAAYDGRISKLCAQECQVGTCAALLGTTEGCGGCCGCLGGCYVGYCEQRDEERGEIS